MTNAPVAPDLVCMADIVGVHGVKGVVKLKVHSADPESLSAYETFTDAAGKKTFTLLSLQQHGNIWLAEIDGVRDRTAAEKLRGTKLCTPRDTLPDIDEDGTFYHIDLIGLAARGRDGAAIGTIINVANFGAGDLLEIKPVKGASYYIPFTDAVVPEIDIEQKFAVIELPAGLID